jgi:FixJ family two-component response regulator
VFGKELSQQAMSSLPTLVYIVDDEASVRTAYARLVHSAKMEAQTFASVAEFMRADTRDENACVISDLVMPGGSGLELSALLSRTGRRLPVIFITAKDSAETRDFALRMGASAIFRKPVDDEALLDAIAWAINPGRTTSAPLKTP